MTDIVKSHNQRAEWEMSPAIDETADSPFLTVPHPKAGPGPWLNDVRDAEKKKADASLQRRGV